MNHAAQRTGHLVFTSLAIDTLTTFYAKQPSQRCWNLWASLTRNRNSVPKIRPNPNSHHFSIEYCAGPELSGLLYYSRNLSFALRVYSTWSSLLLLRNLPSSTNTYTHVSARHEHAHISPSHLLSHAGTHRDTSTRTPLGFMV